MEKRTHHIAFPVILVAVMVAFLSAGFIVAPTISSAASKKSAETRKTAVEFTESRITQLKTALNITEDQAMVWNNLTQVMRENAKDMDALSKERAEKNKTMNAVEHVKFHSRVTEAQAEQQKKFIPAFEALYAALSDTQKTTLDSIFRTGAYGKHKIK